jgi:iron complex outermembrane receptor protein
VGIRRDTFELDFRRWSKVGERNALVWGVQSNTTSDQLADGANFIFEPNERTWSTVNGFAQWTRTLVPDRLFALVGSKLTHHDFVGFEVQPSARLWWTPNERWTWWGAVSRPVRVPSRLEEDGLIVVAYADPGLLSGGPPIGARPFGVGGDRALESERMIAYELGHRYLFSSGWQLTASLFFHDYDRLVAIPASVVGTWTDTGKGETHGIEVTAAHQVTEHWRIELLASWLELSLDGPVLEVDEGAVPELMAQVRSSWDVSKRLQIHGALYHVDRLPASGIDAYDRLDLGLTWRLRDHVELAFWGQNLIDPHVENGAVELPRGGYVQVRVDL